MNEFLSKTFFGRSSFERALLPFRLLGNTKLLKSSRTANRAEKKELSMSVETRKAARQFDVIRLMAACIASGYLSGNPLHHWHRGTKSVWSLEGNELSKHRFCNQNYNINNKNKKCLFKKRTRSSNLSSSMVPLGSNHWYGCVRSNLAMGLKTLLQISFSLSTRQYRDSPVVLWQSRWRRKIEKQ